VKRPTLGRPVTSWTGSVCRCGFSTWRKRPEAGRARPIETGSACALRRYNRTYPLAVVAWPSSAGALSDRRHAGGTQQRSARADVGLRRSAHERSVGTETYVSGHADSIINYAAARRSAKPISTATTESTVQRLIHRRMTAKQQMRWSPRGAHLVLKVRTAVMNATFWCDHIKAELWARRPYRQAA
jgi:hypothetical protein